MINADRTSSKSIRSSSREGLSLFSVLLFSGCIFSSASSAAQRFGDWNSSFSMGVIELSVANGPGNVFVLACNEGADMLEGSSIDVRILNQPPKPNSRVNMIFDGNQHEFFVGNESSIHTNSHVDADNFIALLAKLKKSKTLLVQFSDGRSSNFSLKGAAQALKGTKCRNGYYD